MNKKKNAIIVAAALLLANCASVRLPPPEGELPVGTAKFDLIDVGRDENYNPANPSKRRISIQAWYPADSTESCRQDYYISPDLGRAMQKYMGIPSFIIGKGQYSNSYIDAPVSSGQKKYPVILFNHGYGSYGGQNYSQMEMLARKGFIVFSISHPHTTILTEFADGTALERSENSYWANMKELQKDINKTGLTYKYHLEKIRREPLAAEKQAVLFELSHGPMYADLQGDFDTWVDDTVFVVDSIEGIDRTPGILFEKFDLSNIGVYGHSFGGSVAAEVALRIPSKVKAGINLDGPCLIYEDPKSIALRIPFMFVYSTDLKIGAVLCNQSGINDAYYLESESECYSATLAGSGHHNFSDMTYIGILKNFSMLGPINGRRAGLINDMLVSSFFEKYLKTPGIGPVDFRPYPELAIASRQHR